MNFVNAPNRQASPTTDTGMTLGQPPQQQTPPPATSTQLPQTSNPQLTSATPMPAPPQQPSQPQAPQVYVAPVVQNTQPLGMEAPVTTTSVQPQADSFQVQKSILDMVQRGMPLNASHITQARNAGADPAFIQAVMNYAVGNGWNYQSPQPPDQMVHRGLIDTPAPVTTTTVAPPPAAPQYVPLNAASQKYQNWQGIADQAAALPPVVQPGMIPPTSYGDGMQREASHTGANPQALPPGAGTGYNDQMRNQLIEAQRQATMRQRPVNRTTSIYTGIAR